MNQMAKAPHVWHTLMLSRWVGAMARAAKLLPLGAITPVPHTTWHEGKCNNHSAAIQQHNIQLRRGGRAYVTTVYWYQPRLRLTGAGSKSD
jgi:hypothetical protein